MRATAILVLLAVTRVAFADDREEARTEFAAGQQADRDKDYTTAIQHFTRANELVPHPFALYNIATDYERLGALREAARFYQLYLDKAPPGPERDKVARLLQQLQTRPASLSVRTLPGGAHVKIDGNDVGSSPVNVTLPGGPHHVVIDRGRDHEERDVDLQYGEPGDVVFSLSGTPGRLNVSGTPTGAFVAIDNITVGAVPGSFDVAAGPHTVKISASGYTPYETGTSIEAGQSTQLEARLPRDLSTVDLQGDSAPGHLSLRYAVGVGAGADLSRGDALGLGEVAFGANQYEGVLRLGHASGTTQFDFLFRWMTLPTVVSPFLSVGYSAGAGDGYLANAGLRWDVHRDAKIGFSILAAIGVRIVANGTDSTTGAAMRAVTYPLELTAEVRFR
ncbi:hypothetical protein BH11MYX1_BH11MYX1_06910 [soil metagenome]